jgi:hypothetical protein
MRITLRSTCRGSLPYSGLVMDEGADRKKPEIDIASLEVGHRYRVDWRHEQLRRTFRATGTLLSVDETPAATPGQPPGRSLTFEVKPRFGPAALQHVDIATLRSIEPA